MNAILKRFSNNRFKAIVFIIICAILWSTSGILIKLVRWNPVAIAGSRSFISSLVLLLYIRKPRFTWSKAQLSGAVFYSVTVILFVSANKLTTAANAILLQYTAPIFVALLGAWILKERTKWFDWLAIAAVLGGMLLFFIDSVGVGGMTGNILSIVSGFFMACSTIALRYQKDGSPIETSLLGNILTFLVSIPFIFQSVPDTRSIIGIILLGTIQLGLSYILYTTAIKYLTALESMLLSIIEPLLNPIWVFLFSGEKPTLFAILGGFVVLTALVARNIAASKSAKEAEGKHTDAAV